MSEIPFGFGKPGDPDDSGSGGSGGSGGAGGRGPGGAGGMGFGPLGDLGGTDISSALHRFADLLSWQGGPVNWDLAKDVARQAAAGDDPSIGPAERAAVTDAIRLAELWLDPTTSFPAATTSASAWSRAEWIEATLPTWTTLVEPVAAKVVEAFGGELTGGLTAGLSGGLAGFGLPGMPPGIDLDSDESSVPGQLPDMAAPLMSMMRQMGGVMFGGPVGQALGTLAREVVSSTDVGLPLAGVGHAALIPAGIAAFGEGLGVAADEVRLYVALREAACHRLFAGVPWLRGRLLAALDDYARGITVDTSRMQEALGSIDPTNPEALQQALTGGLFEPENTPAQQAALARLETLLALIEGWIDDVVTQAAEGRLASAAALGETVRRRRAGGGPAEQTFGTLVGLQLRPRRMREAAQLWQLLREARGTEGRDALWEHPDLLPTVDDLDDPAGFVDRRDNDLDLTSLDDTPPGEDPQA
ncbi:MAG TPA: zinc-dependent metalloprotease [Acidothermaceae bacterium]|nr:zinc-dependent metalloprotease [Acidothermaceae bacterium]